MDNKENEDKKIDSNSSELEYMEWFKKKDSIMNKDISKNVKLFLKKYGSNSSDQKLKTALKAVNESYEGYANMTYLAGNLMSYITGANSVSSSNNDSSGGGVNLHEKGFFMSEKEQYQSSRRNFDSLSIEATQQSSNLNEENEDVDNSRRIASRSSSSSGRGGAPDLSLESMINNFIQRELEEKFKSTTVDDWFTSRERTKDDIEWIKDGLLKESIWRQTIIKLYYKNNLGPPELQREKSTFLDFVIKTMKKKEYNLEIASIIPSYDNFDIYKGVLQELFQELFDPNLLKKAAPSYASSPQSYDHFIPQLTHMRFQYIYNILKRIIYDTPSIFFYTVQLLYCIEFKLKVHLVRLKKREYDKLASLGFDDDDDDDNDDDKEDHKDNNYSNNENRPLDERQKREPQRRSKNQFVQRIKYHQEIKSIKYEELDDIETFHTTLSSYASLFFSSKSTSITDDNDDQTTKWKKEEAYEIKKKRGQWLAKVFDDEIFLTLSFQQKDQVHYFIMFLAIRRLRQKLSSFYSNEDCIDRYSLSTNNVNIMVEDIEAFGVETNESRWRQVEDINNKDGKNLKGDGVIKSLLYRIRNHILCQQQSGSKNFSGGRKHQIHQQDQIYHEEEGKTKKNYIYSSAHRRFLHFLVPASIPLLYHYSSEVLHQKYSLHENILSFILNERNISLAHLQGIYETFIPPSLFDCLFIPLGSLNEFASKASQGGGKFKLEESISNFVIRMMYIYGHIPSVCTIYKNSFVSPLSSTSSSSLRKIPSVQMASLTEQEKDVWLSYLGLEVDDEDDDEENDNNVKGDQNEREETNHVTENIRLQEDISTLREYPDFLQLLLFILFNPNYQRRIKQTMEYEKKNNNNKISFGNNTGSTSKATTTGIPTFDTASTTNPYNVLIHRTAQLITVISITSPNDNYVDRLESYTLYTYLLYAHDLMVNQDCLLDSNVHDSIYPRIIKTFLRYPVIANGYLHWIQYQVEENDNFLAKPKIFTKVMLTHLSLLQNILQIHHFTHHQIFNVLHSLILTMRNEHGLAMEAVNDIIKHSLSLLLQLLTFGYTLPILRFIGSLVSTLDHSLIRHFLASLGTICQQPFSKDFTIIIIGILRDSNVSNALNGVTELNIKTKLYTFLKCLLDDRYFQGDEKHKKALRLNYAAVYNL